MRTAQIVMQIAITLEIIRRRRIKDFLLEENECRLFADRYTNLADRFRASKSQFGRTLERRDAGISGRAVPAQRGTRGAPPRQSRRLYQPARSQFMFSELSKSSLSSLTGGILYVGLSSLRTPDPGAENSGSQRLLDKAAGEAGE
jgi:hypothetical protein